MLENSTSMHQDTFTALNSWIENKAKLQSANRTVLFEIQNDTPWDVEIAFGQIKAGFEGGGYIKDTGVFSMGQKGDRPLSFDPHEDYQELIAGNTGSISILLVNGGRKDDQYPVLTDPNRYYETYIWRIFIQPGVTEGEEISIERLSNPIEK